MYLYYRTNNVFAEMLNDKFVLEEHINMKWLTINELDTIEWTTIDIETISNIKNRKRELL